MRIISCQSTLVAVVAVALIVVYYTEAKTTPKPKYQYTKKPVPQITVHSPVTTSVPKTLKIVPTANPVKPHPPPNPVRTTNPSHVFPQHYPDSTGPPGVGPENYTLDYNECYFNFCECCPPERGPRGLKGERGLTGIDSLICFNVINYCLVCLYVWLQIFHSHLFYSGATGEKGLTGAAGLPGPPGISGPIGLKGEKGTHLKITY